MESNSKIDLESLKCGCPGQQPMFVCVDNSCPNHLKKRFFCAECLADGQHDHPPKPVPRYNPIFME